MAAAGVKPGVFSLVYIAPINSIVTVNLDQIYTKCLVIRPNLFTMEVLSPTQTEQISLKFKLENTSRLYCPLLVGSSNDKHRLR